MHELTTRSLRGHTHTHTHTHARILTFIYLCHKSKNIFNFSPGIRDSSVEAAEFQKFLPDFSKFVTRNCGVLTYWNSLAVRLHNCDVMI
jgi:hypothetical protein